jgi:micrococcal nuclease
MIKKYLIVCAAFIIIMLGTQGIVFAHPGGLDGSGGHTCRTNCAKYGLRNGQYHNHKKKKTKAVKRKSKSKSKVISKVKAKVAYTASTSSSFPVVKVIDGDTIDVAINGTIERLRLIGVDTPETKDPRKPVQCFGTEASRYTTNQLLGTQVKLENDYTQADRDIYGRLLRYVIKRDGTNFNEALIRNGLAHEYTYNIPYKYQTSFRASEVYAKNNSLGLWSPLTCNGTP